MYVGYYRRALEDKIGIPVLYEHKLKVQAGNWSIVRNRVCVIFEDHASGSTDNLEVGSEKLL